MKLLKNPVILALIGAVATSVFPFISTIFTTDKIPLNPPY